MLYTKTNKKIGLFTSMSFAIGAMIGGGVFVLTGVAMKLTGPSAILSFLIAGIIVTLSALSFGKVAAHAKKDESGYAVVGDILHSPVWGFMTSWCFYLSSIIGSAFVLHAFGTYLHTFVTPNVSVLGWSIAAAFGLMLLNFAGASFVGKIERLLVIGKLAVLVALIVAGVQHFSTDQFVPFLANGTNGLFHATSYLFIAFLGFSVITSISGEINRPEKTIPKAIFFSMISVMILYIGIVVALLAAPVQTYSESSVGEAARQLIGPVGGGLVIVGALVATLSAANANLLGSSEIMVRLALRKQIPTVLGRMHSGIPYVSVLVSSGAILLLLMSGQTDTIIALANVTAITALIIVNIAAIAISHRKWLGWILPLLGIIGAFSQFFSMSKLTLIIGGLLVGSGAIIYAIRERHFHKDQHRSIKSHVKRGKSPLVRALK